RRSSPGGLGRVCEPSPVERAPAAGIGPSPPRDEVRGAASYTRRTGAAVLVLFTLVLGVVLVRVTLFGSDRRVVLVGDALTLVSAPALRTALARDNAVTAQARLGVTVEMMQPVAVDLAATGPEHAVIELGT